MSWSNLTEIEFFEKMIFFYKMEIVPKILNLLQNIFNKFTTTSFYRSQEDFEKTFLSWRQQKVLLMFPDSEGELIRFLVKEIIGIVIKIVF